MQHPESPHSPLPATPHPIPHPHPPLPHLPLNHPTPNPSLHPHTPHTPTPTHPTPPGKSTFLNYITQESPTIAQRLHLVPEPVADWQDIRPPGAPSEAPSFNILQKFYEEPAKYAYLFQNYVFLSRMMQVGGEW
jgi:hypothetical protein